MCGRRTKLSERANIYAACKCTHSHTPETSGRRPAHQAAEARQSWCSWRDPAQGSWPPGSHPLVSAAAGTGPTMACAAALSTQRPSIRSLGRLTSTDGGQRTTPTTWVGAFFSTSRQLFTVPFPLPLRQLLWFKSSSRMSCSSISMDTSWASACTPHWLYPHIHVLLASQSGRRYAACALNAAACTCLLVREVVSWADDDGVSLAHASLLQTQRVVGVAWEVLEGHALHLTGGHLLHAPPHAVRHRPAVRHACGSAAASSLSYTSELRVQD